MRVQVLGTAACLGLAALAGGVLLREPEPSPPQLTALSQPAVNLYVKTANEKVRIYRIE